MSFSARAERVLVGLVTWGAVLTFFLWLPLVSPSSHSFDDAEPEILNGAYRLSRGLPLYHGLEGPPWVVTPYPPLYTALVALSLRETGLSFAPARLLSALSTLALGLAIVALAKRWQGRAGPGVWAACLLMLVPAVLYNSVRPHPQMLAVALSVWSFALFESPHKILSNFVSPLLAVLACYTKQTQIALPLAMGLFLLLKNRPRFVPYAFTIAGLGLPPLFFLQRVTGGAFLNSIGRLAILPYDSIQIATVAIEHMGILFPFIGLAFGRLFSRLRRSVLEPVDGYLLVLALFTIPTLGRVGAHTQYVLETLVVIVLYLLATGGFSFRPGREGWAVFQFVVLFVYAPAYVLLQEGIFDRASNAAAPEVRALLASRPGPIVSQQGSFSLFTRGEIHVQLFHFMGLHRMGSWNQEPLLREVEEHRIAWVVTESPLEGPLEGYPDKERFSPELWADLGRHYLRRAKIGPYYVYAPRAGEGL
jgi:hypothetical protein